MPVLRTLVALLPRLVLFGTAFGIALLSCGREPEAPATGFFREAHALFTPVFPVLSAQLTGAGSGLVAFTNVRVVLRRAGGRVALDTVIAFPSGVGELGVGLKVSLSPDAPATGEQLQMTLAYVNAAGTTVFEGGPVTVTAIPTGRPAPAPVQVPVRYTGPGASAIRLVISPRTISVFDGDAFTFAAVAQDAGGATLPGTPIAWGSLESALAAISSPAAGTGVAGSARGTARIVAQLLTGPADTVTVRILLRAASLTVQSGDAQSAAVGAALAQPIVTRVVAKDGAGVAGVSVAFAVATGGGSTGSTAVTTDAAGLASTTWTLGSLPGPQSVTVSAAGLSGSPLTLTATASPLVPVRLDFLAGPPATIVAGAAMGPVTVRALDAQGALVTTFAGQVTIGLAATSAKAPLLGTLTATAAAGVATFTDLRVTTASTGYVLAASASGLAAASSTAFEIIAGPAQVLEFGTYPVFVATAGTPFPITVVARDAFGNVAQGFTGTVALGLAQSPAGAALAGTTTAAAVSGVATFGSVRLTAGGVYQLSASAAGVTTVTGPVFVLRPAQPATSPPVAVSAGMDHTCVVRANGAIYCWGANANGQLGDGTTTSRLVPTPVATAVSFASVSASSSHTCALTAAGIAWCWGDNSVGQLGNGTFVSSLAPVAVAGGLVFSKVLAGVGFSCGFTTAGIGYCWGGAGARLGNGTNFTVSTPTAVAGGLTFTAMSLFSDNHVCAVATGGSPYCWGYNFDGAVGDNTTTDRPVPTLVLGGLNLSNVASGWFHSCGLSIAGAAYCWGDNNVLQLGWGTPPTDGHVPGAVLGGNVFTTLAAGNHTCGLRASGAAYCWGINANGNLGDGTTTWSLTPVAVTGGLLFTRLTAGNDVTCGITTTSALYCWGLNSVGQLGDGTTTTRLTPVQVPLP